MSDLCLFDLDDTLLPLDSDHAWGEFVCGLDWVDPDVFRRRNDAFFEDYKRGALDIHAYIGFATEPLRMRDAAVLAAAQERFMRDVIVPRIGTAARELVQGHQARGDLVALVTATNDFVTAPIAAAFGIEHLIAVRLERRAGGDTITGRIDGTPSYREGKVPAGRRMAGVAGPVLERLHAQPCLQRLAQRPAAARTRDPSGRHQSVTGARGAGPRARLAHPETVR